MMNRTFWNEELYYDNVNGGRLPVPNSTYRNFFRKPDQSSAKVADSEQACSSRLTLHIVHSCRKYILFSEGQDTRAFLVRTRMLLFQLYNFEGIRREDEFECTA